MIEPEPIDGLNTHLVAQAKADRPCQRCDSRRRQAWWYGGRLFGGMPQPGFGDLALCAQCAAALRGSVSAVTAFVRDIRYGGEQRRGTRISEAQASGKEG